MLSIGRRISLWGRKADAVKDCDRVLCRFAAWRAEVQSLPPAVICGNTLLLIRLDDIGDYLLFRNQLEVYKKSARWSGHHVTLLGNEAWRDLFTRLDDTTVDDALWVHKNRYLESAAYRLEIWRQLRSRGFETVIAPAATRPLLLDDLCTLATGATACLGARNSNVHPAWNAISDRLYTSHFEPSAPLLHEFQFNAEFAEWCTGHRYAGSRPHIGIRLDAPTVPKYILCFVGASTRSRRWPVKRWIRFVTLFRRAFDEEIIFAGNSKTELEMVRKIQRRTLTKSIAGSLTLPGLLPWIMGAEAVISNDTMAAHLGAILDRPTVIVANGVNYTRFSDYSKLGAAHVATVYPEVFNRHRRRVGDGLYAYSDTVTADIVSIKATTVLTAVTALLKLRRVR